MSCHPLRTLDFSCATGLGDRVGKTFWSRIYHGFSTGFRSSELQEHLSFFRNAGRLSENHFWVHFCTIYWSTMLNKDRFHLPPGHLVFSCKPRFPCYFLCWLKLSLQDIVNVILGIKSSSFVHHVQICEPVHTHYPPCHDIGTELNLFNWLLNFLWLVVDPIILSV